jgi:subtilisin family serine protease
MMPIARIRAIVCTCVAATLLVSLLGGSPFAATADSRRKILILDDPLTPAVFTLLATAGITVLYDLSSLINALAVQLPLLPPIGTDPLALLDMLGDVTDDVLTFIDPICPTGVPVFEDPLQEYRWGMQQIKAPEAHMPWPPPSRQTGVVTVAVLDTGIAASHPELSGRTVQGYNAITKTGVTTDDHGHGTHMAGIILANKNGGGSSVWQVWSLRTPGSK